MKRLLFFLISLILLVSCGGTGSNGESQPTAVSQTATAALPLPTTPPTSTTAPALPTAAVQPTTAPTVVVLPAPTVDSQPTVEATNGLLTAQEAIQIQEPGPGWRLTSPIHVSGMADPTFEQNLVVRLLLEDGSELAVVPVTIASDNSQRGPFAVDIPFTISGERQAFLQVYASSARDGGITHLSSVGLIIADAGPENRPPFTPINERIVISEPLLGAVVSGGLVHVEGVALASFEATLLIEVVDEAGNIVGSEPVLVQSPDIGLPGFFEAAIAYDPSVTGAGRIVVRDLSPAFGGDVHVASVEIRFE